MGLTIDNIINTWPLGLGVVKHGSVKIEDVGGLVAAGLGGPCLDFSPAIGIGSVGGLGGPLQKKMQMAVEYQWYHRQPLQSFCHWCPKRPQPGTMLTATQEQVTWLSWNGLTMWKGARHASSVPFSCLACPGRGSWWAACPESSDSEKPLPLPGSWGDGPTSTSSLSAFIMRRRMRSRGTCGRHPTDL